MFTNTGFYFQTVTIFFLNSEFYYRSAGMKERNVFLKWTVVVFK